MCGARHARPRGARSMPPPSPSVNRALAERGLLRPASSHPPVITP
jgi:hypothetical protein